MLCAISGEAPQTPVASKKSGIVFEKRLIEAYIQEHGTDPVTGEDLTAEDLVELKNARTVKPRPPTLTSIPALLNVFQNEWDALALESYTLKQQLSQLQQELSTALYNNDAAIRVIARLMRERDEARDALGKVSIHERKTNGHAGEDGDAMQVDVQTLPDYLSAKVDATQEQLSKTRRKRPVPEDWATLDDIQSFDTTAPVKLVPPGSGSLSVNTTDALAFVGGAQGLDVIYSLEDQKIVQTNSAGSGSVNDILILEHAELAQVLALSTGVVKLIENGLEAAIFGGHKGPVTGLALHPCNQLFASVGEDKSFALYDLEGKREISRTYTSSQLLCCQFHPDGHILAAGAANGQIKVFDVRTCANVANFDMAEPVQSLSFSENGTWLAAVVKGSTSVVIWDLRKAAELKTLEYGSRIDSVQWDYTGQFLAGAGPDCVVVQHYDKGSKSWSEPLRKAVSAVTVRWGRKARSLVVLNTDGAVEVLQ